MLLRVAIKDIEARPEYCSEMLPRCSARKCTGRCMSRPLGPATQERTGNRDPEIGSGVEAQCPTRSDVIISWATASCQLSLEYFNTTETQPSIPVFILEEPVRSILVYQDRHRVLASVVVGTSRQKACSRLSLSTASGLGKIRVDTPCGR